MDITEYIKPELFILIPVMYLIGAAIKKSFVNDTWIPFLLGVISVLLSALYIFAQTEFKTVNDIIALIFTAITQGILIAGASVYCNQLIKQYGKED